MFDTVDIITSEQDRHILALAEVVLMRKINHWCGDCYDEITARVFETFNDWKISLGS